MKVYLVGGFSGSGKTTAIENACEILAGKNIKTSVFRDNKVSYLASPLPSESIEISSAKVSDGCSCCNYYDLYFQINSLKKEKDVTTIFAEYSGTCTNLIKSLLYPLRAAFSTDIEVANFSTFTDAGLLLMYLKGAEMPLSAEDKYTWERHLLESEILIVNKADLLSDYEVELLQTLTGSVFGSKRVLLQNSTSKDSINSWIEIISNPDSQQLKKDDDSHVVEVAEIPGTSLLDEEIEFTATDKSAVRIVCDFMNSLTSELYERKLQIVSLHFFLSFNGTILKLNHPNLMDKISSGSLRSEKSDSVDLMVNARVVTSPSELRDILFNVLNRYKALEGVTINEKFISYFQC